MSNQPTPAISGLYPWLDEQWVFFERCLELDRLAHAQIIEGPAGCGKSKLAKAMVAKLLCRAKERYACGACRSCKLLEGGAHPELIDVTFETDPKTGRLRSVITVDQVRRMIEQLQLTTSISSRKVTCISPADRMHSSAVNALLKSLEEPAGEDTVLILVTDSPGRLPITIRSRCQVISVNQPDRAQTAEWLAETTGKEAAEINAAIDAAGGSPLRARTFLVSPELDAYQQVRESLAKLLLRPGSVSIAAAQLAELDVTDAWRWLSALTGDLAKAVMMDALPDWIPANIQLDSKSLLQLQQQADINRQLSNTTVRGDLLLQTWLIHWAELVIGSRERP
ncbi:MAG: DNA polymerase III subunit delta' [Xanthomonadales bacterium]|nr:DNA polymerase III subunit delta' [Xanthomonadales bacterium]